MSFGTWLKNRRKALDLTQQELAQRVGCAVITVQKIEADERRPSKQMAGLLAGQLGIGDDERPAFIRFARVEADAPWSSGFAWSSRRFTNLPARPAPLIGRDQDLTAVRKRLVNDGVRLLTLVGPPGVGKTRLAIQAATGLLDDFVDGVYLVRLAPVGDPDLVAATVARTLGVNQIGDRSFDDRLKEYLRYKHMLLVLDNFEQVLAAGLFVSELLVACPLLSIMITSRAPLRLRREQQFPVAPLALLTTVNDGSDPAELIKYSAIALFVKRAQAVRSDLTLDENNGAAIAAICTRLDGLPLAIELVAGWTRVLPPQALLERLRGRLMLHSDGQTDVSDRHRTLYNAIDWSYALLTPDEQLLLTRSGVFVDGWSLEAVEWMMSDVAHHTLRILEMLTSLVDKNLVVQQEHGGSPRFTLLETVREYTLTRLAENGEEQTIRQRHAEYYLALAEEADPNLRTAAQGTWLDRLDMAGGNLRAALTWFIEQTAQADSGLRLAGALGWYWTIRGTLSESRDWLTKALQMGGEAPPALRANVLSRAGSLAWYQGDLTVARSLFEESIALCKEVGVSQRGDLSLALAGLGMVASWQADHDTAQAAGDEAVAIASQVEDKWFLALALNPVAEACMIRRDYALARSRFEESLALFCEVGDKWGIGTPLMNLGYLDSLLGNYDGACARLEESIAMHSQIGERWMRSVSLTILAQVVQQQGDLRQAAALYHESLDLFQKMGLESNIADVLRNLAQMALAQGHDQMAARLYEESLALYSRLGNEQGIANCRTGLAAVANTREDEHGS